MSWACSEGRLGVFGFERSNLSGLAVVGILQESKVFLNIGNINVFSVGRKKDAMSFSFTFVNRCDGFTRNTLLVEWVDVEPSVSITNSEQMFVFLIEAQEAGAIVKIYSFMLQVRSIGVQKYNSPRDLAGSPVRCSDIE